MKKAFSMLELVIVIIIIGILSAMLIPRSNKNNLHQAAIQLISHIRYAQHLARIENKFEIQDANWYKKRWQILFGKSENKSGKDTNGKIAYSIFTDSATASSANPNLNEIAIDPMNPDKYLTGGFSGTLGTDDVRANKQMNIGDTYGISDVNLKGGCSGTRIIFDQFGRPFKSSIINYKMSYKKNRIYKKNCDIVLTDDSAESITIHISSETGFVYMD